MEFEKEFSKLPGDSNVLKIEINGTTVWITKRSASGGGSGHVDSGTIGFTALKTTLEGYHDGHGSCEIPVTNYFHSFVNGSHPHDSAGYEERDRGTVSVNDKQVVWLKEILRQMS